MVFLFLECSYVCGNLKSIHTCARSCIWQFYTMLDTLHIVQVAMKNKTTLLVDDLSKYPMCAKNEDVVNFNYCYYVGAPWCVGNLRGTSSVKQL